mgnify:CR=1 FL=1
MFFKIIIFLLDFMNNNQIIIYKHSNFYKILNELNPFLKFDLVSIENDSDLKSYIERLNNYLIVSKFSLDGYEKVLTINNFPITINSFIQKINLGLLKSNFNLRSKITIQDYMLDYNSRKISYRDKSINLTEQEVKILLYLRKFKKPVNVKNLQKNIWGYNQELDTHTVETHIYRLRKKFSEVFNDNKLILSSKNGYSIK